jgi:hypothetical protein
MKKLQSITVKGSKVEVFAGKVKPIPPVVSYEHHFIPTERVWEDNRVKNGPFFRKGSPEEGVTAYHCFSDEHIESHSEGIARTFDDSDYPDCGFEAMSQHTQDMTQLERWISESCYCPKNGGQISHPRLMKTDGLVKYQRYEYMAKRLQCSEEMAHRFIKVFKQLDISGSVANQILKRITKAKSVDASIVYLEKLALEMPDPQIKSRNQKLEGLADTHSSFSAFVAKKPDIFNMATIGEIRDSFDNFLAKSGVNGINAWTDLDDLEYVPAPDSFKYIPIGELEESKDSLSYKYYNVVNKMFKTLNYIELKKLCGQAIKSQMSNNDTSWFIRVYTKRKAESVKFNRNRSKSFDLIYTRLDALLSLSPAQAQVQLNKNNVGHWLANLAHGRVTVTGYTPDAVFTKILTDKYFELKKYAANKQD